MFIVGDFMKNGMLVLLSLFAVGLYSCGSTSLTPLSSVSPRDPMTLLRDAEYTGADISSPEIVRSRYVKINTELLLDEAGQARKIDVITLNLFPDVSYIGEINQIEQNGSEVSWVGTLKGVEFSDVFIVFSSGIFMVHVASPQGIYEISAADNDFYRVVLIDQTKLPGGGQD